MGASITPLFRDDQPEKPLFPPEGLNTSLDEINEDEKHDQMLLKECSSATAPYNLEPMS